MDRSWGRVGVMVLVAASMAFAGAPAPAAAQVTRETQVDVAPEAGVREIDRALRDDLSLFPDVVGFIRARLFQLEGGALVLEIESEESGNAVRERRPISLRELAALRARVSGTEPPGGGQTAIVGSTNGRIGVVIGQSVLGLAYYGWAVADLLDVTDDDRKTLGAYLVTSGASFLAPYLLTRNRTVSLAHRDLSLWGGTRGILYGILVEEMIDPGNRKDDERIGEEDRGQALALGGSLLGSVVGFKVVDWTGAAQNEVDLWGTLGDFGLAYSYAAAIALGLYEPEECSGEPCYIENDDYASRTGGNLFTFAGGLGSLFAAAKWAPSDRYTSGDARALRSFGLLGAQAVLPLTIQLWEEQHDNERLAAAAMLAGSLGGLYLGDRVLARRSLTGGEGWLVLTGHIAGGLGFMGLAYAAGVDPGDDEDEVLFTVAGAAGSAVGSLLTLFAFTAPDPTAGNGGGAGEAEPLVERDRFEFELAGPGALTGLYLSRSGSGMRRSIPLLTIRF